MASLKRVLREPFTTLTSLSPPPKPGTRGFKLWNRITELNVRAYRATGGKIGGTFDGAPVLLLHHVGRKSGERRVTPLLYLADGEDLVIVASMGGTPKHPAWYLTLQADARTEVEVGRDRRQVVARTATAEEKERLWPRLVAMYGAYAVYQERTSREIPVVILSPA